MILTGKRILLISPQAWNKVKVSKHHYAIALAEIGNEVYFLNPPIRGKQFSFDVVQEIIQKDVKCVTYNAFAPLVLRYYFRALFDLLIRFQVKRLIRKLGTNFDIVWSFEPNLYTDLGIFGAPLKIFHPVDVFEHGAAVKTAESADILFSVSPSILGGFGNIQKPKYFINHGLGKDFREAANKSGNIPAPLDEDRVGVKKVGYIGNLLIEYLDRDLFKNIIVRNPGVHFLLIGPYETTHSSLGGGDGEAESFVSFLKNQGNVTLLGPKGSEELPSILQQCDAFLILYTDKHKGYDLSNTHKMLEYLSTGKVVFSTPIKAYEGNDDIIVMPGRHSEETYVTFFSEAIGNIDLYNLPLLQKKRIQLALDNTYEKQIAKIEECLNISLYAG